jgi:hypothetical protein
MQTYWYEYVQLKTSFTGSVSALCCNRIKAILLHSGQTSSLLQLKIKFVTSVTIKRVWRNQKCAEGLVLGKEESCDNYSYVIS